VTSQAGEVVEVVIGGRPRPVMICVHPAATLYDRSQEDTFAETIAEAVALAGLGRSGSGDGHDNEGDGPGTGQSRLGEF